MDILEEGTLFSLVCLIKFTGWYYRIGRIFILFIYLLAEGPRIEVKGWEIENLCGLFE